MKLLSIEAHVVINTDLVMAVTKPSLRAKAAPNVESNYDQFLAEGLDGKTFKSVIHLVNAGGHLQVHSTLTVEEVRQKIDEFMIESSLKA